MAELPYGVIALDADEARKRVAMALLCNYDAHGNSYPLVHLDNILNGRWFAVPKRYGGERADDPSPLCRT